MNAVDSILDGDEEIVQAISESMGMVAAEKFVDEFNNGCLHMSGFEEMLMSMKDNASVFYAPLANLSHHFNH